MTPSNFLAIIQAAFGLRVFARMLATAAGEPIAPVRRYDGRIGLAAVMPVLDEAPRIEAALAGLCAQPEVLRAIVIADGGSTDGTQAIVRRYAARDPRVILVDAAPVASGWNGKAWNLAAGLAATDPNVEWIVLIDADVRPEPCFAAALAAHAEFGYVDAFGAAPRLQLSGALEAGLHPALLATLVYRLGLPGNVARGGGDVQANGQCFAVRRDVLVRSRAIERARASRCEDYTMARALVAGGAAVGFYEAGALATVAMYASAAECWRNWPRSLSLRDASTSYASLALAFADVALVQALPLAFVVAFLFRRRGGAALRVNLALLIARFGVLAGMHRAYQRPAATYWLSPLCDLPALGAIVRAAWSRDATWRGRTLVAQVVR